MIAPFPYFGGKRSIAADVWRRLGTPAQYIEPFCGSAAMLLAAPSPAALEVVNDASGFIANFWRATKCQPAAVAEAADYPVSHVDLGARHGWLMAQRERVAAALGDPEWPGDAQVAGWWLWGQCCWIGSGWCEWERTSKIPHVGDAGRGVQAIGKIPHVSDAGRGDPPTLWTSAGRTAWQWLHALATRLERVRVTHGDWSRCLNHHFGTLGANVCSVFLDPPYRAYEKLYGSGSGSVAVADAVASWAADHPSLRIALCGHRGDYDLPGWDVVKWSRLTTTYGGTTTTDAECIWYSPACLPALARQTDLFGAAQETDHVQE